MVSSMEFRRALGRFATGVTIVSAGTESEKYATTVNAFSSVSIEPPLILVCLAYTSKTYQFLAKQEHSGFAVNVLTDQQKWLAEHCSTSASKRFDEVSFERAEDGIYRLPGSLVSLICRKKSEFGAGDHTVLLAEVIEVYKHPEEPNPLLFYGSRFSELAVNSGTCSEASKI
ncbi:MAG: flavin reductase family protein [Sulfobacillus sp.]